VGVGVEVEFEFLDLGGEVVFFAFALAFGGLVFELPVIEDFTDGGAGVRGDLDEIETVLPGFVEGIGQLQDPEGLAVGANGHDFSGADALVDALLEMVNG
jgi:hypothetical protein